MGASARINLPCLSSAHKSAGMGWRKAATFRSTCAREIAPGMIEATIEGLVRFCVSERLLADDRLGEPGDSQGDQSALMLVIVCGDGSHTPHASRAPQGQTPRKYYRVFVITVAT